MASDNFMWFPQDGGSQIQGETTDQKFAKKGAFELSSFKFSLRSDETTEAKTATTSSGKAKFGSFTVTKKVDSASVPLYKACCQATIFPSIMLAVRMAGGSNLLYLQYIFRYNQVVGVEWDGGSEEDRAKETVTFIFKAMGVQYIPQMADGREGTKQQWSWNTANQGSPGLIISGIENPPEFLTGTGKEK
jgi:type VI protein secretion system component Hcp